MNTIIRIITVSIMLTVACSQAQSQPPHKDTTTTSNAIMVYDANDVFLGIAHDGGTADLLTIFIPSLGAFAQLQGLSTLGEVHIRAFNSVYATADGMPYVITSNLIQRLEDCNGTNGGNRYFVGSGRMMQQTVATRWQDCEFDVFSPPVSLVVSETYEVMEADIPFPLPIAMPLKFK